MVTLEQLRQKYPGAWITGTGLFAVICQSANRVTLFPTLAEALLAKDCSCGKNCDRYREPHVGYRLSAPEAAPVRRLRPLGWDDD
jgi:hypothetical protein